MTDGAREGTGGGGGRGLYGEDVGAHLARAGVGEFIGTWLLVYVGTAVACAAALKKPVAGVPYDSLAVVLAFGMALVVIVAALAHTTGAHVNPAVTIALAATGKAPLKTVPVYIGAQIAGAVAGSLSTWATLGSVARDAPVSLGATLLPSSVGFLQGVTVEALVTFILVFVIISVATDPRVDGGVPPLAIGFALAVGIFAAGPVTGGSLNPARTLGPGIVTGQFGGLPVYLIGPVVGGVIAAFVYDRFVGRAEAP